MSTKTGVGSKFASFFKKPRGVGVAAPKQGGSGGAAVPSSTSSSSSGVPSAPRRDSVSASSAATEFSDSTLWTDPAPPAVHSIPSPSPAWSRPAAPSISTHATSTDDFDSLLPLELESAPLFGPGDGDNLANLGIALGTFSIELNAILDGLDDDNDASKLDIAVADGAITAGEVGSQHRSSLGAAGTPVPVQRPTTADDSASVAARSQTAPDDSRTSVRAPSSLTQHARTPTPPNLPAEQERPATPPSPPSSEPLTPLSTPPDTLVSPSPEHYSSNDGSQISAVPSLIMWKGGDSEDVARMLATDWGEAALNRPVSMALVSR